MGGLSGADMAPQRSKVRHRTALFISAGAVAPCRLFHGSPLLIKLENIWGRGFNPQECCTDAGVAAVALECISGRHY